MSACNSRLSRPLSQMLGGCGGNSGYNPGYGYNPAINIQQVTEESIDVSSQNFTCDVQSKHTK